MTAVFDSTALAVWLTGGPGARRVGSMLTRDEGVVSALSVFELSRALGRGGRLDELEQLATIAPFDAADAQAAAGLPLPHLGLPVLAQCALAVRLGVPIITADPSLSQVQLPGVDIQLLTEDEDTLS